MKLRFGSLLTFAALPLLVLLVPPTWAQSGPDLTLASKGLEFVDDLGGDHRITPETETAEVRAEFSLRVPPGAFCSQPVTVLFHGKAVGAAAHYATLVLSPTQYSVAIEPSATGYDVQGLNATMKITVARDAPAFLDGIFEVTAMTRVAMWSQGCHLGEADPLTVPFTVKNDYRGDLQFELATPSVTLGGPSTPEVVIRAHNSGNGATRVASQVVEAGQACQKVVAPPEAVVAAPHQRVQDQELAFKLRRATAGVCSLTVEFVYGSDNLVVPLPVTNVTLTFVINLVEAPDEEEAPFADVPSIDASVGVMSVAALAALWRRSRTRGPAS